MKLMSQMPSSASFSPSFKGEFRLGNTQYCYPLTVTDHASRYLLLCEALDSVRESFSIAAFQHLFAERGLPDTIRSDNGVPFASPNALFNLSNRRTRGRWDLTPFFASLRT